MQIIKNLLLGAIGCLLLSANAFAGPLPQFVTKNGRHMFLVDGKPFIMLGAQLHNSSAWASTMEEIWPQLEALHVNTVEVPVYWQTVEPQPGQFNFDELDRIIEAARTRNLRLVLLWFATWKNGMMNYAPQWIKQAPDRYPHVIGPNGKGILVLSPHSKTNLDADRRAFTALMTHLKEFDGNN
ncbi:MAG TPA: beta-galactosidase, partial [Thermoguttaceae bacterium]